MGKNKHAGLWGLLLSALCWSGTALAEVVVDDLSGLGQGTVGIKTPFTADVFGTEPVAETVIQHLNAVQSLPLSGAERAIVRMVLMTDVGGVKSLDTAQAAYWRARADVLLTQGLFEDVLMLTDQIPPTRRTDDIRRDRATALFALGRYQDACAGETPAAFGPDERWIRAVCADVAGDEAPAALAFDVYREAGTDGHALWTAAGNRAYQRTTDPMPTGLSATDISVWELPLAARVFGDRVLTLPLNRGQWRVLALAPDVGETVRLTAAERAGLNRTDWERVLAVPVKNTKLTEGPVYRARLYQKAMTVPPEQRRSRVRDYVRSVSDGAALVAVAPVVLMMTGDDTAPLIRSEKALRAVWTLADKADLLARAEAHRKVPGTAVLISLLTDQVPEPADRELAACERDAFCRSVWNIAPAAWPVSETDLTRIPTGSGARDYPPAVAESVARQVRDGPVGKAVLNAVILLNRSSALEQDLLDALAPVLPAENRRALLTERWVKTVGQIY